MFSRLPARATFVADTKFVSGTQKNVSDFAQKHFVSATNVSQFAQLEKHHGQQCVLVYRALTNEDTLLPTQMFPRLPARATFVADINFVSGTQKMFLILFRNILCPQQMFPSLRSSRNIMGNNVSATMCPRLPGPFDTANVEIASSKKLLRHSSKGVF